LAALPIAEKLKILEKLRAPSFAVAAASLRAYHPETVEDEPSVSEQEDTESQ
jgi:hypothetical protein